MADGVVENTGKPWNKQRMKEKGRDGKETVGCQHNEDKNLAGSLSKANDFLERADSLQDHILRKDVA